MKTKPSKPTGASELRRALAPAPGAREIRTVALQGLEFREAGEETGGNYSTLAGHAAVFETLSQPLYDWWFGEYREQIAAGAFADVLGRNPDVHLVYVHDMASAMARTHSKTLQLRQDDIGLRIFAQLDPDDLDVQRIAPKMRRGDVDQMSFAFCVARDADGTPCEEWLIEGDVVTRTILEIGELYDVSVVPQGAYTQTDVSLRSRELRGRVQAAARDGRLELPPEALGRPSVRSRRLQRADMASVSVLADMYELGQEFMADEVDPEDAGDRDVMAGILEQLETLIEQEAAEPDEGDTEGRSRRSGGSPEGEEMVAPDSPAGVSTERAKRLAAMRIKTRLADATTT